MIYHADSHDESGGSDENSGVVHSAFLYLFMPKGNGIEMILMRDIERGVSLCGKKYGSAFLHWLECVQEPMLTII